MKKIFVFGSNLAGRHGKGAALTARLEYAAEYGIGIGRTGNAYAIPTKGFDMTVLSLQQIEAHVHGFLWYAQSLPHLEFFVTKIGRGLAGFEEHQIAPFFENAPINCELPEGWRDYGEV